ncbi:MAG: hypothetical protein OIF58_16720 [Cohaesibacter sp.]|nr:hypothetical protein [Cohaesibacter sp.]
MITSDFNQNNGISLFVLVLWVFFSSLALSSMNFRQGSACVKSIQQWQKHQSSCKFSSCPFPLLPLVASAMTEKKEGILNCVPHSLSIFCSFLVSVPEVHAIHQIGCVWIPDLPGLLLPGWTLALPQLVKPRT